MSSPSPALANVAAVEDVDRNVSESIRRRVSGEQERQTTLSSGNSPVDGSPEPPLSVLGFGIETPTPSDGDTGAGAEDLSQGRFGLLAGRSLAGLGFDRLQVLSLAGSALKTQQLGMVLAESKQLKKLDASHCRLNQTPAAELFADLAQLTVLFLHKNQLARWDDIERAVQAPALAWLTAFENPIASQPEFRHFVIGQKPRILAVDHWVVTDAEHLGLSGGSHGPSHGSRFAVQNQQSVVNFRSHLPQTPLLAQTPQALLLEAQEELWTLRHKSNSCSAACCIQTAYRGSCTRRKVAKVQRVQLRAVMMVQRRARTFLWRRRMLSHLKDYLAEIDELDLLLSAKEMLRLRAAKLIEVAVRRWIGRRNQWKMVRKAAECVNRATRGFLARRYALRNHLELMTYRRIYFPEEYKWEFLVMLNMVRRVNGFEPFPRDHAFMPADVVGIRIPDTDEVPRRDASLMAVVRFARHCIVRPLRNHRRDRYPDHEWDGPLHKIVDKSKEVCKCPTLAVCKCSFQAKLNRAYMKIRRRGANVDAQCRRIFKMSCCPDKHPIDEPSYHEDPDPSQVSLVLKAILEGPETNWPRDAQHEGSTANLFMHEARALGSRPRRSCGPGKGIYDSRSVYKEPESGLPCYRNACWLSQRLLYHECQSEKIVLDMLLLLVRLSRHGVVIPMVKPVPFLAEKDVRAVSAVTAIQSAWRAHCVRCSLACGLRMAVVMRRAAICIQRGWRWGLMKRRLELLTGAVKYVASVKTTSLYVEERLYTALNVIGSLDRYPPLLQERTLGLGYIESDSAGSIVLVRSDLRGVAKMKASGASPAAKEAVRRRSMHREGGLPSWFLARVGELKAVGPDDTQLVKVSGVQGLLKEGLACDPENEPLIPISMASIKHAAKLAADSNDGNSAALVASAGNFQFRELKFHNLVQARQRALLLYLCTYNAQYHVVVPLLSRSMLHDVSTCKDILRLWDLFGLTWPAGDRAAPWCLKQKGIRPPSEVVPLSGNQPMRHIGQGEWQTGAGTDKKFSGWIERREKVAEETRQKFKVFAQQYEEKQKRDICNLRSRLQDTDIEKLHEGPAPGAIDACVTGALPPATASRVQENPAAVIYQEKLAAKTLIQEAKDAEVERVRRLHDSVFESRREKEALCFEDNIRAFHSQRIDNALQERRWLEDQKHTEEDGLKAQNHRVHLELAHKRAENDIIAKAQMIMKKSAVNHITPSDMKAYKRSVEEEEEDRHRAARLKRAEQKQAKEDRKAATAVVQQFLAKSRRINFACRRFDEGRRQEAKLYQAQVNADHVRRLWAQRSAALAACNDIQQQFKMGQVDDMKRDLEIMKEHSREHREMEMHQQRWHVKAQKSLDAFLVAARAEIERSQEERDVSAAFRETYQRAVASFSELSADTQQSVDDAPDSTMFVDDTDSRNASWTLLGWEPMRLPASDVPAKDRMVADMLAHVESLQARKLLQQNVKTISSPLEPWDTPSDDASQVFSPEPLKPSPPDFISWYAPPAQPAFGTPKPSPMLPPRVPRPPLAPARHHAKAADQPSGNVHSDANMSDQPSSPSHTDARMWEDMTPAFPTEVPQMGGDAEADSEEVVGADVRTEGAEHAVENEQDQTDQLRTMPKKRSKKHSSSTTLIASNATLTTVVGSSQTGSLATLDSSPPDSSQASLPIRLPPLRPPPRPSGAPRGILPRRPPPRSSSQPPPRPHIGNVTLKSLESVRTSSGGSSDASSAQRGLSPGAPGWKKWSMPLTAR